MTLHSSQQRRIEIWLFTATFFAYAYFHQGGGWNQNARFALVRAIVEQGHFFIDSHLVYLKDGSTHFVRAPIINGEVDLNGKSYVLGWPDAQEKLAPVNGSLRLGANLVSVEQVAATGDVAFSRGHFHPAKAPGTSLLAVPAYSILYWTEALFGFEPDQWWILTLNSWLTSVFTVALASAFGCVLFFRFSVQLSDGQVVPALLSTLTFSLGTMFFPYATMFYEHNLIAVALLASFSLINRAAVEEGAQSLGHSSSRTRRTRWLLALSGLSAGIAAVANYLQAAMVLILGIYLVSRFSRKWSWFWYALGLAVPFLLLCFYSAICFGTPFTTNYQSQSQRFISNSGVLLGVFVRPRWELLPVLLFSPFRGLFSASPVLVLALPGLFWMFQNSKWRKEAIIFSLMFAFMLMFNISFNGWHGGWAFGPRYLMPVLPFLGLPLVFVWQTYPRTTGLLAVVSLCITLIVTAVNPQPGVGIHPEFGTISGERHPWSVNPILEYQLPLFFTGKAGPVLTQLIEAQLDRQDLQAVSKHVPAAMRQEQRISLQHRLESEIERGEPSPFLPSSLQGPVSVNSMGMYESWFYGFFPAHSSQSHWNSFNLGEFFFPQSRLSLVPLVVLFGCAFLRMLRLARRTTDLKR